MRDLASLFGRAHPHLADFLDIDTANRHAELLRSAGLQTVNDRVLASPRVGVLDVIAEHNMGAELVSRGFTALEYEPPSMPRPIDFVGVYNRERYRIEVKRIATAQHDDLHANVLRTLTAALTSHREPVAIAVALTDEFEAADINSLTRDVKQSLAGWHEGQVNLFPSDEDWVARYTFHYSPRSQHPHAGVAMDATTLDVTGDERRRVQNKVRRAYKKFATAPDDASAHLVTIEVDNTVHLGSVAEALYGREYVRFAAAGGATPGRFADGMFRGGQHSRLGGVLLARRTAHRLFVPYTFIFFSNPGAAAPVGERIRPLGVGQTLGPTDYP